VEHIGKPIALAADAGSGDRSRPAPFQGRLGARCSTLSASGWALPTPAARAAATSTARLPRREELHRLEGVAQVSGSVGHQCT
jgi:hypothetical protein